MTAGADVDAVGWFSFEAASAFICARRIRFQSLCEEHLFDDSAFLFSGVFSEKNYGLGLLFTFEEGSSLALRFGYVDSCYSPQRQSVRGCAHSRSGTGFVGSHLIFLD